MDVDRIWMSLMRGFALVVACRAAGERQWLKEARANLAPLDARYLDGTTETR
jgi:hypothetical protein